jgi:hypothetical protein
VCKVVTAPIGSDTKQHWISRSGERNAARIPKISLKESNASIHALKSAATKHVNGQSGYHAHDGRRDEHLNERKGATAVTHHRAASALNP